MSSVVVAEATVVPAPREMSGCTSFVVMKELRLETALTSDRHFAQAGFRTTPNPTT